MMNLKEIKGDLFDVDEKYFLVHCISRDAKMGAGIAVEFQKRFNLRERILSAFNINTSRCILIDKVFNLITKEKYYEKPSYRSMTEALEELREKLIQGSVKNLAMPRIGCGLDGLKWDLVKTMIYELLGDLDIEVNVYYKEWA